MNRIITLLSTLLLLSLHTLHAQTIRYVKEGGTGDGSSWSNASGDLQGIIDASGSGDEVWVAKGTYKPTVDFFNDPNPADPRFKSFKMRNGLGIYGGFRGVITETQRIQRNWKNNVTILSGDIGTPNDNSDNSYSVILNQINLDNTARLDGFTITDGNANGFLSITTRGGGANNSDCSPLYANCIFTGNSASSGGAGMVNQNASTILINCSFINNNCNNGNGGGMANFSSSSPKMINCSFAGNTGIDGGAIENQTQASAILTNCIIWGNTSGVLNTDATATITYSIVQDGYDGTGNLNTDPLFVDANNGNLRLESTSPVINTGNDAANSTDKDLDAYVRKVGRIDIGAYEYQGPATPPSISVQPAAMQSACLGNTPPTLKVVATGDGLKYQWYSNSINTNIGGTEINAANTDSYIPPITTLGTQYYYVVVSGDNPNPVTSDISAVTVNTSTSRLYVNASATGASTGLSWQHAFTDLQSALNYTCLTGQSEIWVAGGTYKPTSGTDRSASFVMKNGVAIYGGFAGTETLLGQRNWQANVTTLSGDIGTEGDKSDNSYRVVFNNNNGLNNTAVLDGFTITGGNNNLAYPNNYGGGMYNNVSSPTLINCTFLGNSADEGGGGMYNEDSKPTLINCTFLGNTTGRDGGGMYNYYSAPVLTNCTFSGNAAGHAGGGMYNLNTYSPTLINCSFSGNSAPTTGGIHNFEFCELKLTNCILWGDAGGEIYNGFTCYVHLYNSIVQGGCPYPSTCTNVLDQDPLFVSTTTLHLQPCSPALDAGINSAVHSAVTTDIDGNPRIANATNQTTATVDMGAYEFVGSAVTTFYKDSDNDGYSDGTTKAVCSEPPTGFKAASALKALTGDCDDDSAALNPSTQWYKDADGDGYSDGITKTQCSRSANYKLASELTATTVDCEDNVAAVNPITKWYRDVDNDGYSSGATLTQCTRPTGSYKLASELTGTSVDCSDNNPAVNPGAVEVCGNRIDDNCNGQVDEPDCSTCRNATNLITTNITTTGAQLNWSAIANPQQWQVQYKTTSTGSKWIDVLLTGNTRSVTISSLKPKQSYNWHVRAKCNGSWTDYSSSVNFTTTGTAKKATSEITMAPQEETATTDLQVRVMPNPSNTYFTIILQCNEAKGKTQMLVTDALGRSLEARQSLVSQTLQVGGTYRPGVYFVRFVQGEQSRELKLIKLSN